VRVLPPSSKTNPPIPTKSKDDGWLKAAEEDLKSLRKRLTCLTILRIAEAEEQQEGVAGVRPADVEAASSAMIPNADEAPAHWPATTVGGAGADDVRSEAGVSERWDGVSQRWEDELSEAEPIDGADGIADVETDVERPPDGTAGEGEEGPGPPPETLLKEDETPKSVSDEALQAFLAGAGDDGFDDRSTDYGDDEARSPAPADEGSSACGDENESSWPGLSVSPDQFRRQRPSPPRDMPSLTLPPAAAPLLRVGGAPDDGEPEAPELPPYAPEGFTFAPMTPKKRNKGLEEGDGGSAELDGRRASIESARTTLPRPSSDSVRDFSPDGRPSSAFGDFSPEEEEDRRWSPRRWSAASAASSAMIANADEDHEAQKEKVGDVDDDEDADPPGTPAARPRSSIDAPTGTPPPRHERRFPHAPSSWTGGGGDVDATDAGLKRSLGSAFETAQSATAGTKQPRHGGSGLADRHFSGGFASGEEEEKADADVGKHAAVEVDIYGGEALAERLHAHRASADWSRWSRKCALQNLTPSRDAAASAGAEGFVELQADHVPEAAPVGADVTATVEEPAELEERNREGDIFGYASEAGVLLDGQGAEGPQREEQREAEGEAQVLADNDEEDEEAGPRGGGGALVVQETSYSSPPAHLPAAAAVEMDLAVVAADAGAVDEAGSGDAGELEADGYAAPVADDLVLGPEEAEAALDLGLVEVVGVAPRRRQNKSSGGRPDSKATPTTAPPEDFDGSQLDFPDSTSSHQVPAPPRFVPLLTYASATAAEGSSLVRGAGGDDGGDPDESSSAEPEDDEEQRKSDEESASHVADDGDGADDSTSSGGGSSDSDPSEGPPRPSLGGAYDVPARPRLPGAGRPNQDAADRVRANPRSGMHHQEQDQVEPPARVRVRLAEARSILIALSDAIPAAEYDKTEFGMLFPEGRSDIEARGGFSEAELRMAFLPLEGSKDLDVENFEVIDENVDEHDKVLPPQAGPRAEATAGAGFLSPRSHQGEDAETGEKREARGQQDGDRFITLDFTSRNGEEALAAELALPADDSDPDRIRINLIRYVNAIKEVGDEVRKCKQEAEAMYFLERYLGFVTLSNFGQMRMWSLWKRLDYIIPLLLQLELDGESGAGGGRWELEVKATRERLQVVVPRAVLAGRTSWLPQAFADARTAAEEELQRLNAFQQGTASAKQLVSLRTHRTLVDAQREVGIVEDVDEGDGAAREGSIVGVGVVGVGAKFREKLNRVREDAVRCRFAMLRLPAEATSSSSQQEVDLDQDRAENKHEDGVNAQEPSSSSWDLDENFIATSASHDVGSRAISSDEKVVRPALRLRTSGSASPSVVIAIQQRLNEERRERSFDITTEQRVVLMMIEDMLTFLTAWEDQLFISMCPLPLSRTRSRTSNWTCVWRQRCPQTFEVFGASPTNSKISEAP